MFLNGLLHSVSYFFFLYWSPNLSLCTVFDSISPNVDEVLLINPSAVFVYGDFNVHHKDFLTYSGRTDQPGELCNNLSQKTLPRRLIFLQGSQTVIVIVLPFWISFFLLTLVFVLKWLSLHWKFWSCCLSVRWLSIKFTKRCPVSSHNLWLFSSWLGRSSWSFERYSMGEYL